MIDLIVERKNFKEYFIAQTFVQKKLGFIIYQFIDHSNPKLKSLFKDIIQTSS